MSVHWELISECPVTKARRGRLHTPHGTVETPAFMPVGTQATVKTVSSEDLEAMGYEMVLSNTYHLALRPSSARIQHLGGLHKFMGWHRSILTDSGGYQVMSLSAIRKMTEEGVEFRSHLDGSALFLSPEDSVRTQRELMVDITMALDECPPYPSSKEEVALASARTFRWAQRSLAAAAPDQAVFGIVQGGVHEDLRQESASQIASLPFAGFAIGGVSVGEPSEMQYPVVASTTSRLPKEKVRYLMGVGHPRDILNAISHGVDLFDCVLPTRMARHHALYTLQGRVNISAAKWEDHDGPVDENSVFPTTARYSAAYLRHLFNVHEPLGPRLATLHNLSFYERMMQEAREAIAGGTWPDLDSRYAFA
jgi:queuine tRNA-ribosyltransferase